jgi:hypothetical protein
MRMEYTLLVLLLGAVLGGSIGYVIGDDVGFVRGRDAR